MPTHALVIELLEVAPILGGISALAGAVSWVIQKVTRVLPLGWTLDNIVVDKGAKQMIVYFTLSEGAQVSGRLSGCCGSLEEVMPQGGNVGILPAVVVSTIPAIILKIGPYIWYTAVIYGVAVNVYSWIDFKKHEVQLQIVQEPRQLLEATRGAVDSGVLTKDQAATLLNKYFTNFDFTPAGAKPKPEGLFDALLKEPVKAVQYGVIGIGALIVLKDVVFPMLSERRATR